MDPLGEPLATRPFQTGWEFSMEPYPGGQFGFIDDPDCQFGNGSVWTRTRTRSDGPEPLLTLLLNHILAGRDRLSLVMHWEAVIEQVWRYTWRPRWSELRDAPGGRHGVNSELNLEAVIDRLWGCTWRPWSIQFGDANRDWDWVNSEMHLEAVIERVWTCTWRQKSSELRDALWRCHRGRLEMHLQAMIERDWRSSWRHSIWRETQW